MRTTSVLLAAALALVATTGAPACVNEQAGHQQSLRLRLEGTLPPEVQSAHLAIGAAELMPCASEGGVTALRARLSAWLVPTAQAHTASSALRIGTPRVISLLGDAGTEMELGLFQAPEGSYCRVHLQFAPPDVDAEGILDGGLGDTLHVTFEDGRALRSTATHTSMLALAEPMRVEGAPERRSLVVAVARSEWPVTALDDGDQALHVLSRALHAP